MSKSRAQELRMRIDHLKNDILAGQVKLKTLRSELRLICPHPDEYVIKLDRIKNTNPLFKVKTMYHCKLCGVNKLKGN